MSDNRCRGRQPRSARPEEIDAMKRFLVAACCLALASTAFAQQKTPASPPEQATATIGGKTVTINYSSPGVKGREGKIFSSDGLISHDPHYPVWRAGANSATALHTDGDLTIGDLAVPAGDYTLFVDISNPDRWTLIVSKATKEWGLKYDSAQDLGKTPMTMSKPSSMVENLKWTITDLHGGKGKITLAWEDHSAAVSVNAH
jgi:hypothetical protein